MENRRFHSMIITSEVIDRLNQMCDENLFHYFAWSMTIRPRYFGIEARGWTKAKGGEDSDYTAT